MTDIQCDRCIWNNAECKNKVEDIINCTYYLEMTKDGNLKCGRSKVVLEKNKNNEEEKADVKENVAEKAIVELEKNDEQKPIVQNQEKADIDKTDDVKIKSHYEDDVIEIKHETDIETGKILEIKVLRPGRARG